MSGLSEVVRAGIGRRRAQTAVLALTAMLAVAASVLGAGLLVAARAPFDDGFQGRLGAHLTAQFDAGRVGEEQVRATARVAGVTGAAGPFGMLSLRPRAGANGEGDSGRRRAGADDRRRAGRSRRAAPGSAACWWPWTRWPPC